MVKFGKHIEAQEIDGLLVPYNTLKRYIIEDDMGEAKRLEEQNYVNFVKEWRAYLHLASEDFQASKTAMWQEIFKEIFQNSEEKDEVRGAKPEVAIKLYIQMAQKKESESYCGEEEKKGTTNDFDLLSQMKNILHVAVSNAESLRKIVKKFDKYNPSERQVSVELLPLLYSANFVVGQDELEESIEIIRRLLHLGEYEDYVDNTNKRESTLVSVTEITRKSDVEWLQRIISSMDEFELQRLVSHRGFHHIDDSHHTRPLENSLAAYELAWTSGLHLCECDINVTKDERIILAHDEDFTRLALDPESPLSQKKVSDLTFKEIVALPLQSGSRPPLLIDVLRSAQVIGGNAKLIIEIKPGNTAVASALASLLYRNPELIPSVAMIMSFDLFIMHLLRRELNKAQNDSTNDSTTIPSPGFKLLSTHGVDTPETLTSVTLPSLMLITTADPPVHKSELRFQINEDVSNIHDWIHAPDGSLDGVYLQYEQVMKTKEGADALKKLGDFCDVGVWNYAVRDPDDYETFEYLIREGGVKYFNTDLPSTFKEDGYVSGGSQKSSS
eukprot:CAMPEP_0178958066 /NCGR_PEP_ID=MMETSP0789-20121207/11351_1 /TAXON_ID=3005 /ORGANISM="Rhizosolenia setigera, Strain CCMP 1694" /LENGTH=555 /DNA_ID=CAMNT_0020640561 /DNA_START=35 /DNA_END=1702 /DNA_ORIENTATION=+